MINLLELPAESIAEIAIFVVADTSETRVVSADIFNSD